MVIGRWSSSLLPAPAEEEEEEDLICHNKRELNYTKDGVRYSEEDDKTQTEGNRVDADLQPQTHTVTLLPSQVNFFCTIYYLYFDTPLFVIGIFFFMKKKTNYQNKNIDFQFF